MWFRKKTGESRPNASDLVGRRFRSLRSGRIVKATGQRGVGPMALVELRYESGEAKWRQVPYVLEYYEPLDEVVDR